MKQAGNNINVRHSDMSDMSEEIRILPDKLLEKNSMYFAL